MERAELSALAAFAAVATHRSFRRAASELGVSTSALSHILRSLEERLGTRLLNRTTRSVAPTAAGERLLTRLTPALGDIREAVAETRGLRDQPSGVVRLNVPQTAADLLLAPHLASILASHPELQIEIVSDDRLIDIVAAGFDAGIRLGEHLHADMITVALGGEPRFAVVGAPHYFKRYPRPETPRDLAALPCIRRRFTSGTLYRWEFEKGAEILEVDVGGRLTLTDNRLIAQAAREGLGLAFLFEGYVAEDLRRGRLVRVLEDWCPAFPGFFLYYPSRRQMPAALRAFIDALRQALREPQPPIGRHARVPL